MAFNFLKNISIDIILSKKAHTKSITEVAAHVPQRNLSLINDSTLNSIFLFM